MKSIYEKRIKKLEETNLGLLKTTRNLTIRIYWIIFILFVVGVSVIIEEIF